MANPTTAATPTPAAPVTPTVHTPGGGDYAGAVAGAAPLNGGGQESTLEQILAAIKEGRTPPADTTPPTPPAPAAPPEGDAPPAPVAEVPVIDTGNAVLDIAVKTFVASTGTTEADMERVLGKAIEHGDASLIDEAFIKERFGANAESALALARAVLDNHVQSSQQVINTVHTLAGGADQWKGAVAAFKQTATKAMQSAVLAMVESGDIATVKEAAEIVLGYNKQAGVTPIVNPTVRGGANPAASEGLSAAEFKSAIHKLNQNSRTYAADYNKLVQMRTVGKQLGK